MDGSNRVAVFQLSRKTEVLLQTSTTSLLLVSPKIFIVTWYLDSNMQRSWQGICVSLCSIKCMQSQQKSSPLIMSTQKYFVSPLMDALLKTGMSS